MVNMVQYIIAIIIVILLMIGFVLLSIRLRTREEAQQQPKEQVQLQNTEDADDLPRTNNRPKRSLLEIIRRSERTLV